MRTVLIVAPWLLLLSSCGSPPRPPVVDEAARRPANTTQAIELQVCTSERHNLRIELGEARHRVASGAAMVARLVERQHLLETRPTPAAPTPASSVSPAAPPNRVVSVRFDFGSSELTMPDRVAKAIAAESRSAPLIILRGRTDGASDALSESRIARERAAAVRDYLVRHGVDPSRIRTTHQPSGDHVADNTTAGGRSLNRRVEIELYHVLPTAWTPTSSDAP